LGLKPIVPKEYDGLADAHAYNRFVTEGTAYVLDGRVPKKRQVFVLSYYLTGVAYDFCIQKVSLILINGIYRNSFRNYLIIVFQLITGWSSA